jgi:predicted Rossmann-fold nucleotide-binding protein
MPLILFGEKFWRSIVNFERWPNSARSRPMTSS